MNIYVLNSGSKSIGQYKRGAYGQLQLIATITGLSASQAGLTAYY